MGICGKIFYIRGNFNLPQDFVLPKIFRSKCTIKGQFINWHIIDYETWKIEQVQGLSDEQKQLSPWETWNDTLLKERLDEGLDIR
jgi:hypothetical protein